MRSNELLRVVFSLLILGGAAMSQTELVGPLTREEILRQIPEWKPLVQAYSPDLDIVARLQKIHEEINVEIFLGTWCPDCRRHVSAYFKIMDMVANPLVTTTLTGIPRDRAAREKYIAGRDIERVPTIIVSFRGREIGRIVETPEVSVEADLWRIIEPSVGSR
jgi:hypothetical protein